MHAQLDHIQIASREGSVILRQMQLFAIDNGVFEVVEIREAALPGLLVHHDLPQHNGEGPRVDSLSELLAQELLWRHVGRRAGNRSRLQRGGVARKNARAAKVGDFCTKIGGEKDVAWVDVPVDYAFRV